MNQFLKSTHNLIGRHGVPITITKEEGSIRDPVSGKLIKAKTDYNIPKAYPLQIKATQYNYPNLIGKDVVMFYVPGDQITIEHLSMKVIYKGKTFDVTDVQETISHGEVVLYRVLAVKA